MGLLVVRKGVERERERESFPSVASKQEGFGPLVFFIILFIVAHILLLQYATIEIDWVAE